VTGILRSMAGDVKVNLGYRSLPDSWPSLPASASAPVRGQVEPFLASEQKPKKAQSVTRNKPPAKPSELMGKPARKKARKPMQKRAAKPPTVTGYHWRRHGAGYLKPSTDDVWAFMQKMKGWLIDANRKGIPV